MKRKYNALASVPWEIRADIKQRITAMPDGNEKTILALYFIDGLSSPAIVSYCEGHGITSRSHTHYSTRSVQQIIRKHFPEVSQYRSKKGV